MTRPLYWWHVLAWCGYVEAVREEDALRAYWRSIERNPYDLAA